MLLKKEQIISFPPEPGHSNDLRHPSATWRIARRGGTASDGDARRERNKAIGKGKR